MKYLIKYLVLSILYFTIKITQSEHVHTIKPNKYTEMRYGMYPFINIGPHNYDYNRINKLVYCKDNRC